ncbi:MAG: helix-turn-helix domain-containing protein [Alphaproteobacteria bacterium]
MPPQPSRSPESETAPSSTALSLRIVTSDVDDLMSRLHSLDWNVEYNQLSGGRFSVDLSGLASAEMQLMRHRHSRAFVGAGFVPKHCYTFGVLVGGQGPMLINRQAIGLNGLTARRPNEQIDYKFPEEPDFITVAAATDRVDELCDAVFTRRLSQMLWRGQVFPSDNHAVVQVAQQLLFDATDISRAPRADGIPPQPHPHFDKLIIDALLRSLGPPEPVRGWSARNVIVRKAKDLVYSSDDPPKTVSELCQALKVPLRTLEDAFHHSIDVRPKTFLTAIRLNRVRRLLTRPRDGTTVTDAATAMGFFHLGRFTEQYTRLFGERPSETLARARA